jgi:Holliday junction resolvase RusA-like endonuclease
MKYAFDITPMAKPRLVRSDTWAGRKVVQFWYLYKDQLNLEAKRLKYVPGDSLVINFYLPMPSSWSRIRKLKMNGTPHQQTPDIDNLLKGFTDALMTEDCRIHSVLARKFWALEGRIEVF